MTDDLRRSLMVWRQLLMVLKGRLTVLAYHSTPKLPKDVRMIKDEEIYLMNVLPITQYSIYGSELLHATSPILDFGTFFLSIVQKGLMFQMRPLP